jgi:hypothetical protein
MTKIPIRERDVRKEVTDYLKLNKDCFWWWNLQTMGCFKGLPDIEGVYKGVHFYVELKRPKKGKMREKQEEFQRNVEAQGEKYIIARGYEPIAEFFNGNK